jgi:hypothetical protein
VAAKADRLWTFVIEPGPGEVPAPMRADLWWLSALLLVLALWLIS